MLRFQPATASQRYKLEDCVHGDFQVHAFVDWTRAEIGDQDLQDANMTHNDRKAQLLFHINNDWVESINKITITLSSWEPMDERYGRANGLSHKGRDLKLEKQRRA